MKKLQASLHKTNRGRRLRVVVVESDTESQDDHRMIQEDITEQNDRYFTEDEKVHKIQTEVEADVHHAAQHFSEHDEIHDTGKLNSTSFSAVPQFKDNIEFNEGSGARPKQRNINVARNEKILRVKERRPRSANVVQLKPEHCGTDERTSKLGR